MGWLCCIECSLLVNCEDVFVEFFFCFFFFFFLEKKERYDEFILVVIVVFRLLWALCRLFNQCISKHLKSQTFLEEWFGVLDMCLVCNEI